MQPIQSTVVSRVFCTCSAVLAKPAMYLPTNQMFAWTIPQCVCVVLFVDICM
eukprot:NODE_8136_length_297_cov_83.967742_g7396_i0.p2 GENE.NODE_8136_length_297_cov_83.967742_g7396_i0~~NODE_8136_length_297_cov_83.967742_g7396_i0.p2  ORF type:complete len:52 (+),score=14.24 NODE_8136_length_297_cov_83.967742_g7396_i0:134-289(+)